MASVEPDRGGRFFLPASEEPRRRTARTPPRRRGLPTPPRGVPSLVFWPHRTRTAAASPASINCAARVAPRRPHSQIRTAPSGLPEAPAPPLPEDWGCATPKSTPVKQSPRDGTCRADTANQHVRALRLAAPVATKSEKRRLAQRHYKSGQPEGLAHGQALPTGLHGRRARGARRRALRQVL